MSYEGGLIGNCTATRASGSNPGSTCLRFDQVVESRIAPTSRIIESAVCTESNTSCSRLCPVVVREFRRSVPHIPPRPPGHAATRLTTTEATSALPIADPTTLQSTAIGPASGSRTGASATSPLAPQVASATPITPAAEAARIASNTPSRMIRLSVAPRASRIAIAPRRRTARTRNRPPTLAQAISRTAATAPIRIQIAFDAWPACSSANEASIMPGSFSSACWG